VKGGGEVSNKFSLFRVNYLHMLGVFSDTKVRGKKGPFVSDGLPWMVFAHGFKNRSVVCGE
jgi:hypothetical protein